MADFTFLNTADSKYLNTADSIYVGLGGKGIFGPLILGTTPTSAQGIRVRISPVDTIGGNSGLVIFSFSADSGGASTISTPFVGLGADDTSFAFIDGTQTPLTFGGQTSINIPAGQTVDSDPITFVFADTDRLIISFNQSGDLGRFAVYPGAPNSVDSVTQSWTNINYQPDPSSQYPSAGGVADAYNIDGLKEIRAFIFGGYGQLLIKPFLNSSGGFYPTITGGGALLINQFLYGNGISRPGVSGAGSMNSGTYIQEDGFIEIIGSCALKSGLRILSTENMAQMFMNF